MSKMIYKTFSEIVCLILSDKLIRTYVFFVTFLATTIGVFVSPLAGIIIYSSYILGHVASLVFIKYQEKTSVYLQKFLSFYHDRVSFKNKFRQCCSVCDDLSCKRHSSQQNSMPWKHLHINKELNSTVEHFFNRILTEFINSWYDSLSGDKDFLNELQFCIKYATSSIVTRFLEIDAAHVIADKLIPRLVKHIDDYLYMQQIAKLKNVRFNDVAVEYLGKNLHIAATNRKNELKYLQQLGGTIVMNILPPSYHKCSNFSILMREIISGWVFLPLMDVLADPNIINYLVILGINYKSKKHQKRTQSVDSVEFLNDFVTPDAQKKSPFTMNLNRIKNNTDLLYALMQFLKKQNQVNLLQFCLDVDDFNSKLLTPDLSKKQLEELHSEALRLYKEYLDENKSSFICCPSEICCDFKNLTKDIYSVAKLRTSKPLYQAYDYIFNVLETVWLPQFFHSNEFYSYICGSKVTSVYNKATIKNKRFPDQFPTFGTVSKISSGLGKIRGVLKSTQPIEGAFYPLETQNIDATTVEDIILADCKSLFRDLSTWTVSIPSYKASPSNKIVFFCVTVRKKDMTSEEGHVDWFVLRKDQDFYTLKAKLVEFHGENEICDSPLPSRKAGSPIEDRMSRYEEFMRNLLKKPSLRGSDLLYTFLTAEEDFSILISTVAPTVQDIGNIYQSVAYKLRKERGQHLDSFMASFLNSIGKQKEKIDYAEIGEELDGNVGAKGRISNAPKTYKNHVFNDNFGVLKKTSNDTSSSSFSPIGVTESIFYLLRNVFKIPHGVLKIYITFCNISQQFIDVLLKMFIDKKLKAALCQTNLAYLIRHLEDVIFDAHTSPSRDELEKRKVAALEQIQSVCPGFFNKIFGGEIGNGFKILLEILQNPQYNKQLAYNLLDVIVVEMFPNLDKIEENT